jgi:hypothetical protein
MFDATYPDVYAAYVSTKIRDRKFNVDHIWWVGPESMKQTFIAAGATELAPSSFKSIAKIEEEIKAKADPDPVLEALAESSPELPLESSKKKKKKKEEQEQEPVGE